MLNAFSIILRKTNKELEFVQQALCDPSLYPLSISLLRGPYILPGARWPGAVPGAESKADHSLPSATVSEVPQMPILVLFPWHSLHFPMSV